MENINNILNQFDFCGKIISVKPFGSGHINKTFLATFDDNSNEVSYVVQQINTDVFKDTESLMNNIFAVTAHLSGMIEKNGGDIERGTLHFVTTRDGNKLFTDNSGNCWRAYRFVKNSRSYDSVDSAELFGKSGAAFGKFQRYLADFPADTLIETIPNFHNSIWRYNNEFIPAVEEDRAGRLDSCIKEVEFIRQRKNELSRLVDLIGSGELPLRVTHNDTKLNNILFDSETDEVICVIDLDTVMPGLVLYDFGDSIRFGANKCAEDERDSSKAGIMLDYFKAYAEGFLGEAGGSFNDCELDNLAFSAKLITLECAMRFLTDYINGDTYFSVDYDDHNLVRARCQLALVRDMELHMGEMEDIINTIRRS